MFVCIPVVGPPHTAPTSWDRCAATRPRVDSTYTCTHHIKIGLKWFNKLGSLGRLFISAILIYLAQCTRYLSVGVGVGVADGVTVYVDHVGVGVISVTVVNTSEVGLTCTLYSIIRDLKK
jgi:hypothetical protein